jgi:hypothetical protein
METDFFYGGHQGLDGSGPADLFVSAGPQVGAPVNLLSYGSGDSRVRVAQDQSAVAGNVVDVLMAVHVPLTGAGAMSDVERKWLGVAVIVGYAAGENLHRFGVTLRRLGCLAMYSSSMVVINTSLAVERGLKNVCNRPLS